MEQTAALIDALAGLLWPVLVLVALLLFSPQIKELIRSARSRRFTLKVGGQELTMEEVREQQSKMIADLQKKVGDLEGSVRGESKTSERSGANDQSFADEARTAPVPARVLWVDDQPKNNSYYVDQLRTGGVEVELALSTAEALRRLEQEEYRVVISDIGRQENGQYNQRAGLDLLQALAEPRPGVPVALFTSSKGVLHRRDEAKKLGAALITSSGTELVHFLRSVLPEWHL